MFKDPELEKLYQAYKTGNVITDQVVIELHRRYGAGTGGLVTEFVDRYAAEQEKASRAREKA